MQSAAIVVNDTALVRNGNTINDSMHLTQRSASLPLWQRRHQLLQVFGESLAAVKPGGNLVGPWGRRHVQGS
jgi:hypothetical protein